MRRVILVLALVLTGCSRGFLDEQTSLGPGWLCFNNVLPVPHATHVPGSRDHLCSAGELEVAWGPPPWPSPQ
jgi:hypothetical protein